MAGKEPNPRTREMRLRNTAKRRGYDLQKSRRRDPQAVDYGVYWLIDPATNAYITPAPGLDLDGIEDWLTNGLPKKNPTATLTSVADQRLPRVPISRTPPTGRR